MCRITFRCVHTHTHTGANEVNPADTHQHDFPPRVSVIHPLKGGVPGGVVLFLIKRTGGHEIALSFFTAAALHESKLMIKTLSCSKPSLTQD